MSSRWGSRAPQPIPDSLDVAEAVEDLVGAVLAKLFELKLCTFWRGAPTLSKPLKVSAAFARLLGNFRKQRTRSKMSSISRTMRFGTRRKERSTARSALGRGAAAPATSSP